MEVVKTKGKKNKMKVRGPTFQIKSYAFSEAPKGSTYGFKSRYELFDKYKDNKETKLDETLNLYAYVRNMFTKSVSLFNVKDHAKNNLNLAVSIKNNVA